MHHAALIAALIAVAALVFMHRRDRARVKAKRASLFARCLDLFQSYRVVQNGVGYPVLRGKYRGHAFKLEPILDTMAWRKLPQLRLEVTLLEANGIGCVLDFLMRPDGGDFYSPSVGLPYRVALPEGWPEQAVLYTDDPGALPPLASLQPHLGLFEDSRMKELVITPKGVRIAARAWQASRAHYVALREIHFDEEMLEAEFAKRMLDAALGISASVSNSVALPKVA